jgi:16S rRNA (uracil1498-N3)-methyltransferase
VDRSALRHTSAHVLVSPETLASDGVLTVDDALDHHLRRVLRLRDGDTVSATDGEGRWRLATAIVAPTVLLEPITEVHVEAAHARPVTIATAIPKGDRFDWLVQKVTELGVERLVLLHAERSVVRWKTERVAHHLERARRIADEALRQSRRVWKLQIEGPFSAVDVLVEYTVAEPGGRPIGTGDQAIAIGPEGGWADAELTVAGGRVDLGPTILRTETAAIAASVRCLGNR